MDKFVLSINEDDLGGYCDAVGITHCFSTLRSQNELIFGAISEKVCISFHINLDLLYGIKSNFFFSFVLNI